MGTAASATEYLVTINGHVGINPSFGHTFAYFGAGDGAAYQMQVVFTDVGPKVTHTGPFNLFALAGGPGLASNTGGVTYAQPIETVSIRINDKIVAFSPNQRSEAYVTLPGAGSSGGIFFGGTFANGADAAIFRVDGMFTPAYSPDFSEYQGIGNYGTPSIGVNYAASDPGRRFGGYIFMDNFRIEELLADGWTADDPLLPNAPAADGGFGFDFVAAPGRTIFFDPVVATGYDYVVAPGGPNIASAVFPVLPGDADGYSIYALNDLSTPLFTNVLGGQVIDFTGLAGYGAGISGFALRGIDAGAGVDPEDETAFVTGLNFFGGGSGRLTQTPLSVEIGAGVPEPSAWALMLLGFGAVGGWLRTGRRRVVATAC